MLGKIRCDDGGSDNEDVALQSDTEEQCNAKVMSESGFARVADDDLWS